ncbi:MULTISPECIES: c-type cytochrome [unclassified Leisingera]|uniref:c-type cytochrome n=1 Tax=unclassified Leisingera TaxID=2614906 RepID=UPI0026D24725
MIIPVVEDFAEKQARHRKEQWHEPQLSSGRRYEDLVGRYMRTISAIKKTALAGAFASLVGVGSTQAQVQPANADLSRGEELYGEHCASCHGVNLEGQEDWQSPDGDGVLRAPPHDRTGHTWHHDDALLFSYTKFGGKAALLSMGVTGVISGMPGFEDTLSDQDVWDVLAFIKSTWPERLQEAQKQRTLMAQPQGN